MYTGILILHLFVAIILVGTVLLQAGKSGLGSTFGGSSSSVFGARGPMTFVGRVTTVAAIVFMATSLTLSIHYHRSLKSSVADRITESSAVTKGQDSKVQETENSVGVTEGSQGQEPANN